MPDKKKHKKGTSETATNLGRNVAAYFLGTKNTGVIPSEYTPSKSKDANAKYYTWPYLKNDVKKDITGSKYLEKINSQQANFSKQDPSYLPSYVNDPNFDQLYNYYENSPKSSTVSGSSINLGHYQLTPGQDTRGRYLGVYDKYDWNLLEQLGFQGNSWETYDRIYEDEWDKIPKGKDGLTINNNEMPDPNTKKPKVVNNPTKEEESRARRILELSQQWGVPTNQILSQVQRGPKNIYTGYTPTVSTQYYTFGPQGAVANSITDRYEDTLTGYSGAPYNTAGDVPITAQHKSGPPVASMNYGGQMFNQGSYFGPMYPVDTPPRVYENGGGLSRSQDYGSSKKPYPGVKKSDFAGGGRSYPIPTRADAIDALRLAGMHGREDVKSKVYKKYPDLKKGKYGVGVPNYAPIGNPMGMMAYGGTMFREGSAFEDCTPNYVHGYNGVNGIPPKVYDNGGIVPTANSFAASPFPPDFNRYPSYEPAWQSQYPEARYGYAAGGGFNNLPDQSIGHNGSYYSGKNRNLGSPLAENGKRMRGKGKGYADNGISSPYGDMLPIYQPMNIDTGLQNTPGSVQEYMPAPTGQPGRRPKQGGNGPDFNASLDIGLAGPLMGLAALSNQATQRQSAATESARNTRRVAQTNIYNPYRQGTGATALYANGGKVDPVSAALATLRDHGYDIEMG